MFLKQDDSKVTNEIHQGERGEQGDALMSALFQFGSTPGIEPLVR